MGSTLTTTLESLVRSGSSANDPEVKVALARLSAELKKRMSKGSEGSEDFFVAALSTLSKIKGVAHAELRMNCIQNCASYFYTGGYSEAAIQAGQLGISLATRAGLKEWIRKSESFLGIFHADLGDVAQALVHYSRALDIAREIGDVQGEARVLLNLGVALNYAGLFQEAIPCFFRVDRIGSSTDGLSAEVASANNNLAQSYLYTDRFNQGLRAIEKALAGQSDPTNADQALSRTIKETTYVQLALELGQLDLARKRAKFALQFGNWGGTPRGRIMADIADGMCEVYGGNVERGLDKLQLCLAKSRDISSMRTVALVSLVKGCDLAGKTAQALSFVGELVAHFRSVREKSVLSLLRLSSTGNGSPIGSVDIQHSLVALEHREALLRAKVAEQEVLNSRLEMLDRLAVTADLREEDSGEHGYRVGRLCSLMAHDLGWAPDQCHTLDIAARLHDIGKVGVPDRILLTSKELREAERNLMSAHTLIGAELLSKSNIAQLRIAEEIARCHHEWWNGSGYPANLAGTRIPIHARIVALADVFDAMTHGRPYEQAWTAEKAIEQIRALRAKQFDPELTDRFIALVEKLRTEHVDLDEYLGREGRNSPFLQARHRIRKMLAQDDDPEATVDGNQTRH